MTILAFGCSVMHGAELVTGYQNPENTKYSYSQLVANHLGVDCKNYAVCGLSNEGIFHSFFDNIEKHKDITLVMIGWTSCVREYWEFEGRKWFIIPSWCHTTKNIHSPNLFFKDYVDQDVNLNPRVCADEKEYLDILSDQYNFLMRHKFDFGEYKKKTMHYIKSIEEYCKSKNIKLVETCCLVDLPGMINLNNVGKWRQGMGHPTLDDHKQIAEQILLTL